MSHTETFFRPNIFKTYTETFFETHTDTLKKMKKSLETRCHTLLMIDFGDEHFLKERNPGTISKKSNFLGRDYLSES